MSKELRDFEKKHPVITTPSGAFVRKGHNYIRAKSKALDKVKGKTFMSRISEQAEKSDKERTGQSGRYFSSKLDKILGKKK